MNSNDLINRNKNQNENCNSQPNLPENYSYNEYVAPIIGMETIFYIIGTICLQ